MLDYLYRCAVNYQEIHNLKPNLVYLNNTHLQCVIKQLSTQHELRIRFNGIDLKIVLSPSLSHPSFSSTSS